MLQTIIEFARTHEKTLVVFFVLFFIFLRIPSVDRPLHQDEYKWPMMTSPTYVGEISVPHPPLSEFIYRTAGHIVGYTVNFRYVPLFFGTLNLMLLYILMRHLYGKREAVLAALLWSLAYFSILASLMVDTDGEILPFFFLLALIGYEKAKRSIGVVRGRWTALLIGACILGMLVKLSFILAIGAIVSDFLWSQRQRITKIDIMRYAGYALSAGALLVVLLLAAPYIFPFFNLDQSLKYWEHFFKADRGWLQIGIQCAKAILYASPLLLVPFFAPKGTLLRLRPFFFFLIFSFIFYIVLFDFSEAALDRYLQLIMLPLAAFGAATISAVFGNEIRKPTESTKIYILIGCVVALGVALLQFIPHYIPPLHPKSEWFYRALTLEWDFIFSFHGGSGPLSFYVSFLYMGLTWVVSMFLLAASLRKPLQAKHMLAILLPIVFMYNLSFAEEYHFGLINGSAPKLLTNAMKFIESDTRIDKVLAYNDTGGDELRRMDKYQGRLYLFSADTKIAMATNYYFELDAPRPPAGEYKAYLDSCKIIYRETDRKMSATVYDCRKQEQETSAI